MNAIDVLRENIGKVMRVDYAGCVEALDRLARLVDTVADVYGEPCDAPCLPGCPTCSIRTCLAAVLGEEAK